MGTTNAGGSFATSAGSVIAPSGATGAISSCLGAV